MAYTGKKPIDHTDVTQSQSMTVTDDLTVDTDTLYVDSTNNNVGIGTTSPSGYSSAYKQVVINGGANPSMLQLNNTTTGQGQNSGGLAMIQSGVDAYLINPQATGTTRFFTNNTERMRILSGGGITFNGDTAAANALDDYEEGTFTLTLDDVDNTGLTVYSAQYVKVGNMVTVSFFISFPTTTDTSVISIQLPFQAVSLGNGWQAGTIGYNTSGNDDSGTLIAYGTNNLQIRNKTNGGTRNYASYSGDDIIVSITYRTA